MAAQPSVKGSEPLGPASGPASASTSSNGTSQSPGSRPPVPRLSLPRRVLNAYLRQLGKRPLRTKMITSSCLFLMADTIAQFGIEGRRLPFTSAPEPELDDKASAAASVDQAVLNPTGDDAAYDPLRALRLVSYGGFVFAPLAHNWLNLLQRIEMGSRFKTLAARVAADQLLWGPFIVCLFWGTNGILEGKTPEEVVAKVKLAFLPVYLRSIMVFGPTATLNFAFVPLQHRLLVGQTVGLGWNTYLSYINHVNNKRLAAAAAAHASAEEHPELPEALERTQAAVDAAVSRREKILASQGGGATGVGTRMGP